MPNRSHPVTDAPGPGSADLLESWRVAMLAEGRTIATVRTRVGAVQRAARSAGQPVDALTTEGLRYWLAAFTNAHTRSTYYRSVVAFSAFLVAEGVRDSDPTALIRRPRRPRCLPRPCPVLGLHRVLALDLSARVRAAVVLAAFSGLRVAEISRVRGEDVDLAAGTLRVVGKGGTEAVLPLHPAVVAVAAAMPAAGWWFPSPAREGRPVTANTISIAVSTAMRRAGIRTGGAHALRHLFATTLLARGANVREVQELLRHADLTSTAIYTAVTADALRAAILRLPDVGGSA